MKTIRDKYLKDGVDVEEFLNAIPRGEITAWISNRGTCISMEGLKEWLNQPVKPTLTEDEKVILRNISKELKYIGRRGDEKHNFLYICEKPRQPQDYYALMFEDLFQFIKPRRRI